MFRLSFKLSDGLYKEFTERNLKRFAIPATYKAILNVDKYRDYLAHTHRPYVYLDIEPKDSIKADSQWAFYRVSSIRMCSLSNVLDNRIRCLRMYPNDKCLQYYVIDLVR